MDQNDVHDVVENRVNVLINNAGVLSFGTALDGDLDGFERDLATNYFGALRVTRAFVPVLERNGPAPSSTSSP